MEEINLGELDYFIIDAARDYHSIWGEYPKYLKVPVWVKQILQEEAYKMSISGTLLEPFKYRNMFVCPTMSISQIPEIEVF